MQESANWGKVSFFQEFLNRSLELKGQLYEGYKEDRYLCKRLSELIDIPAIKGYLKDRPEWYSQKISVRV